MTAFAAQDDEPQGLSYEQTKWLTISREIEDILARGFYGQIILSCQDGVVKYYDVNERRKPDSERAPDDRRKT